MPSPLDPLETLLQGPASAASLEAVSRGLRDLIGQDPPPALDPHQVRRVGALLRGWGEWGAGWRERLGELAPPVTYTAQGTVQHG